MPIAGIDVSKFQGTIDWARVKASGVGFVIIRASDGANPNNEQRFAVNCAGARAAGLVYGAYHLFRPSSDTANAAQQAQLFLSRFKEGVPDSGQSYLPAALDIEIANADVDNDAYVRGINTWISTIEADPCFVGRRTMIYTRKGFWESIGNPAGFDDRRLWVADYSRDPPRLPKGWNEWTFFQLSESGHVDGINSQVDLDRFAGTLDELTQLAQPEMVT